MSSYDITKLGVKELSELYNQKKLSPVEVVKTLLNSIEKNSHLNAFVNVSSQRAVLEAEQAEKRIIAGNAKSRIDGVPMATKDLIYTKGIPTTMGCEIYKNFIPSFDAAIQDMLTKCGMPLLGKVNTHQFALGVTTDCGLFGPTLNPYNNERVCGGSSGGSACAVSAGLTPFAIGTDTGGSIRIPSSHCGVVGMKPTYGTVSAYGIMPLSYSLDHVGPITRSVEDNAIMLNNMAASDSKYDMSIKRDSEDFTRLIGDSIKGVRIGVPYDFIEYNIQEGVIKNFTDAIENLKSSGAEVIKIKFPDLSEYRRAHQTLIVSEANYIHTDDIKNHPEMIDSMVMNRLSQGNISASEYLNAQFLKKKFIQLSLDMFKDVDYIATPTTAVTATIIQNQYININGEKAVIYEPTTRFTWLGDLNGFPSISVPSGFSEGLPVGFQIMGLPLDEAGIYKVAYSVC